MLCLNVGDTIAGGASAGSLVTCTINGLELASGVQSYKVLDQRQLAATPATIYTCGAGTQAFVLSIHVVNTDSSAQTFQLFVNGTAAANAITSAIRLRPGGFAVYTEQGGWSVFYATGSVARFGQGATLVKITALKTGCTYFAPSEATKYMYIEGVGGGGGGGGVLDAATNSAAAGGGGAGAYSAVFTSTLTPVAVAIGAGGPGGTAGANNGTPGGDTTFGAILTAKGGSGGISDTVTTIHAGGLGGAGGLASGGTGDIKRDGGQGDHGVSVAAAQAISGRGGNSYFGGGAPATKSAGNGTNAVNYGAGGSGAVNLSSDASHAGGNGSDGLILVWEFGD